MCKYYCDLFSQKTFITVFFLISISIATKSLGGWQHIIASKSVGGCLEVIASPLEIVSVVCILEPLVVISLKKYCFSVTTRTIMAIDIAAAHFQ